MIKEWMMSFENKVVVITGAASGIGYETARLACEKGAKVVLIDLEEEAINNAVAGLKTLAGEAMGLTGDVTLAQDIRRNVSDIMARWGKIDVLVNNAGKQTNCPVSELTEAHWHSEIEINLTAPFLWSQAVAKASMIENSGVIINVGSGGSLGAIPDSASYVAAKHGLIGLTKALAVDWGRYGIRVNCVCPGLTWTSLAKSVAEKNPDVMKTREAHIPLGQAAQPDDQAKAILFLASADALNISGVTLSVDGGSFAIEPGYAPPK